MKYLTVSRKRREQLTKTGLSGGLNVRELPFAVGDEQLTDCCNLWWRNGVLRTRPAARAADVAVSGGTRTYAADGLITRQTDSGVVTGEIRADGTVRWNTAAQAGRAGVRVPYDVKRLDGWDTDAGNGDGTILFLSTGQAVAPLTGGGYVSLDEMVYVPLALSGGVPVETDAPPTTIPVHEPLNVLTSAFRATFATDGVGKYFFLPFKKRLASQPIEATLRDPDGAEVSHTIPAGKVREETTRSDGLRMWYLAGQHGLVFMTGDTTTAEAPAAVGGTDALKVTMHADDKRVNAKIIGGMRFACWFGGESGGVYGGTRLFVGGNSDCPHRIYWSDADRPLYFPTDNSLAVGNSAQAVTAFGKQGDMLVVFKERELYALVEQTRTASGAPFTLTPLHSEIGCDCPATVQLCRNRLVWTTSGGTVYALVSGNAYSGSNVKAVSGAIEPLLKQTGGWQYAENASAAYYDGCYCLLLGKDMLLMDCDDGSFTRSGGVPLWYRWSLDTAVVPERILTREGALLLLDTAGRSYTFGGTVDCIVTYSGIWEQAIPCSLRTKLFDFGYPDRCKTVRELVLAVGMPKGGRLQATYITERGARRDCREIAVSKADERAADFLQNVRLTPHAVKVRRFALELSLTGTAALGPLVIRYDVENAGEKGVG